MPETTSAPTPAMFRYRRAMTVEDRPSQARNACAVLDADVFAHSNPLADLRVYTGSVEVPYVITFSDTSPTVDPARLLNVGMKGAGHLSFDLQMPSRPYSAVSLGLNATDFLANVHLTGMRSAKDAQPTFLGNFTVFDLTSQHLGRSSKLEFSESTFPLLHLEVGFVAAPGNESLKVGPSTITTAEVPPTREAQTVYTAVAETESVVQRGRESVATFHVAAGVPVEAVSFSFDAKDHTNFSRAVKVTAMPDKSSDAEGQAPEEVSGVISRVDLKEAGDEIHEQLLSVPAVMGANSRSAATVEVAVENEDDRPLEIKQVHLEMRARQLCFAAATPVSLYYGARAVAAPVYDFGRFFNASDRLTRTVQLGAEELNPAYVAPAAEKKSFAERYPAVLWAALVAVVGVLGLVALRSAKRL